MMRPKLKTPLEVKEKIALAAKAEALRKAKAEVRRVTGVLGRMEKTLRWAAEQSDETWEQALVHHRVWIGDLEDCQAEVARLESPPEVAEVKGKKGVKR